MGNNCARVVKIVILKKIFIPFIGFILLSSNAESSEILIEPSYIKVYNVPIGKITELITQEGFLLQISNKTSQAVLYEISFFSCKELQKDPFWGYEDIPTTDWIVHKSTGISVPPNGIGYVKSQYIEIPSGKKYYGKRWHAVIRVRQKTRQTGIFNVEWLLPLLIETEKKKAR